MNGKDEKAASLDWGRRVKIAVRLLVSTAIAAATVVGCGWPGTSHSVRFNSYQTEREMGRLPPLPTMANGLNELRASWESDESEDAYELSEKRSKDLDALWERAEAAELDGNLRLDRDLLAEYLKQTAITREVWSSPEASQQRRNSAIDRMDALSAMNSGAGATSIKSYLEARRLHDLDQPEEPQGIETELEVAKADPNLKDNVAYLKAAQQYRRQEFEEAAKGFNALSRQYPRSEKREAALFMAAVATMKTSVMFIPETGSADYDDESKTEADVDQQWHDAFAAFQKVMTQYPRGRYFQDARGWRGYLSLRKRDRAGALVEYYRLLADQTENGRVEGAFSLMLIRSSATENEMVRVEQELADEPAAALAYAYHNIYNYSIDPGAAEPPYDDEEIKDYKGEIDYDAQQRRSEQQQKEWDLARAATGHKELARTLEFSKRLLGKYPRLSVGGAFALRAAQASEELGDNASAVTFGERALQSGLSSNQRAEALWVIGVAEHRRHNFVAARKRIESLLRDHPKGPLTEGARQNLAMIAEDSGDIDGALEQYLALDYRVDVAYFIDVLMTIDQLSGFIEKHSDSLKKNELTYALGVRYLRANRWEEARKTLALVQTVGSSGYDPYNYDQRCQGESQVNCSDPKTGDFDEHDKPIITARLVMRDVQTANDLEALERKVSQAQGDEATAEALYQLASYQYQASSLLFYNPLASPGYWNLSMLAGEGKYRVANESQILWNATNEHERLARALNIYLDIADRFPRTRAGRDSLYTAAVCHERLSSYNPYWREIYQNGLHAGTRMVTYQDVKAAYPNYQFPRGTYGWQPSSRTVNNGPGWQAPPKPPVRLSKAARAKLLLQRIVERVRTFWRETGRRWLVEFAIGLALLFTARIAARYRRRLRARIARQRIEQARNEIAYPWFETFWIDRVEPTRRERFSKFLTDKRQEFLALARDGRSRPLLLENIVAHSLLGTLLLSLIWTAW